MKTKLPFLIFLFFSLICSSQIIWTGGGSDINWNTPENWSSNIIPTSMDNVEIPAGFTVTIMGVASCQSLELKGSAILNIDGGSFFSAQPSFFETGTTTNWASGSISCSLLVNQGTMNLTSSGDKSFISSSIVNNNGTINFLGSGDLFLQDITVLNNEFDGTIDMAADDGNIDNLAGLSILNNEGIIRRSTTSGEAQIQTVEFNNNGGIIQVDSGTLGITGFGDKTFTGGSYIVSSGTVLDWDSTIIVSGFLMGTIEGDLNWNSTIDVPVSATFNFTGGGSFNWTGGNLNGGGILTNESTINLIGTPSKAIQDNTTLNNLGILNIADTGDLFIQSDSVLNNEASGVIDMQTDGGNIIQSAGVGILNNSGLIQRSTSSGEAQITCPLNNNDGTIQVENGTLTFITSDKSLINGMYNVSSGAVLNWNSSMSLSGVLSGAIDGTLNWGNTSGTVSVPVSTTLNFSGTGVFNWTGGRLDGGGVLTNQSTINFTTIGTKVIQGDTTFNNAGTINIAGGGDLFINQGIVNNQASGLIDMQFNEGNITRSTGTSNILNNSGVISRTTSTGVARILIQLNNSGTIDVQSGILDIGNNTFPFFNLINGEIKGVGRVELPLIANYTNDGAFSPGASPGTLTVVGDFESTANSVLDIELDGLAQGTQYDLLAITGNADFNGNLQVALNFDADVNDEFIIATTTGTINSCNFPAMISASFGGFDYEFSVVCRNNNELVLTVTNETLSSDEFELNTISVYPNPTRGSVFIQGDALSKITLFDLNGRKILETNNKELTIQHLNNGIYLLEITDTEGKQAIKKIVKY
ncbi:T9SS type A sorting domain-containing protein [uncultured Winogradskyella sp.]|uniref:T9SS type A sorting domain-containing protein n=1 Tax=uncultured Winogradskyella sp. TaxID=395353 RepID=UPI002637CF54|nr:T9SS type A sorting domain-containing protein [uncultured Winogradskyella sp.]